MRHLAAVAALVAIAAAVHWPMDRAEFSYDDRAFVESNPAVRGVPVALTAFDEPFPPGDPGRGLYRPLTGLSYAIDYEAAGLDARAFHRTNTLLYAAAVVAAYALLLAWKLPAGAAFAGALLFATHPVHCDAVDSISGRSELLAFLFGVGAVIAWLAALGSNGRHRTLLGLSAAAYGLSCLSKESGVAWLGVLLLAGLARQGAARWRSLTPLLLHLGVLLAFLALRFSVLGRFSPAFSVLDDAGPLARFSTMGSVFWLDLTRLVWPAVLEVDFYYQLAIGVRQTPGWDAWLGWGAALGVGLTALRTFRSQLEDPRPDGVAWVGAHAVLIATLLPTSHLVDFGALFGERFLFAASLGAVTLAVLVARSALGTLARPALRRGLAVLAVAAVAAPAALHARERAFVWRDSVRLWQVTATRIEDARVLVNLGAAQLERGEIGAARDALERARALKPDWVEVHGNLGVLHLTRRDLDAAEAAFQRALELEPGSALTWYNLGRVARERGDVAGAAERFEHALSLAPGFPPARQALHELRR